MRTKFIPETLLFLSAFAFWAFAAPYHLLYLEQNRIFEMTLPFFIEHLGYPGGLSGYLGCFVCQFFTDRFVAGALAAVLLVMLEMAVPLSGGRGKNDSWSLAAMVPSLLSWAFLCKAGNLPDPLVALILSLLTFRLCSKSSPVLRILLCIALYYLLGPVSLVYALLLSAEWISDRKYVMAASVLGIAAILPFFFSLLVQMPLSRLYKGVDINLLPGGTELLLLAAVLSVPVVYVCSRHFRNYRILSVVLSAVAVMVSGTAVAKSYEPKRESAFAYDYLSSHGGWEEIIRRAEKKTPKSPLEVTCLNLALAQTGRMGDTMFGYYQNGVAGLFPPYDGNYLQMVTASEALFHSGLLNMALRYTFEAYASSPDFHESPRFLRRMAEINLLNGQTRVAAKYIDHLSHTIFYRKWGDNLTPEFASLRAGRGESDYLFNDDGKDVMLRMAVKSAEGGNKTAIQYLIAFDLLSGNLPAFASDLELVMPYVDGVPVHWQEAAILTRRVLPDKAEFLDSLVGDEVRTRFENYRSDVLSGMLSYSVRKKYGDTFWCYFLDEE